MMEPLRICIDARLVTGQYGGVEQVVIGLANGLTCLEAKTESYYFLVYRNSYHWLLPYLPKGAKLLQVMPPLAPPVRRKRYLGLRKRAANLLGELRKAGIIPQPHIHAPLSDGTIERAQIDVMHFARQGAFLTSIPSIYHPHDLQHVHLPGFFPPQDVYRREVIYRVHCARAKLVAVASRWVKNDVVNHFGLSPARVRVIPLAPPLGAYEPVNKAEVTAVVNAFQLPDTYIFYPAQTWKHKNHIRLLEALAILRDEHDFVVHLVSSGRQNDFYPNLAAHIRTLHLERQVQFLGFVSAHDLHCLYKASTAVVIPTLFEAASLPLWEAFLAGRPAA